MPFQFPCEHCGRKLQASSRKIGSEATCPGCKGRLVVPTREIALQRMATRRAQVAAEAKAETKPEEEEVNPYSEFAVYDDDTELVYETDDDAWDDAPPAIDQTKLAISRNVVYLQGALLGLVAVVAFVLGILVGSGSTRNAPQNPREKPFVISGTITYEAASRGQQPDDGAAILVLPVDMKPERDNKIPIAGIGPDDPVLTIDSPALRTLTDIGGAYARADEAGKFRVNLPRLGDYYVVVLSRNKRPTPATGEDPLKEKRREQLANLGSYVDEASTLLSKYLYDFRKEKYLEDAKVDVQFGKR